MDVEEAKPAERNENVNTIGCGLLTLFGGAAILSLYIFDLGMGRGPIGAMGAILFGGFLVLVGLYRIVMGIVAKLR